MQSLIIMGQQIKLSSQKIDIRQLLCEEYRRSKCAKEGPDLLNVKNTHNLKWTQH